MGTVYVRGWQKRSIRFNRPSYVDLQVESVMQLNRRRRFLRRTGVPGSPF
jgi:hypothetical protein